jgi:Tol biopolymer transport system component
LIDHLLDYEWSSDNETLFLSCDTEKYEWQDQRGPGGIWRWNITSGKVEEWLEASRSVQSLALSPSATRLAYLTCSRRRDSTELRVYDALVHSSETVWRGLYDDVDDNFSWAPDSRHIVISGRGEKGSASSISVLDVVTGMRKVVAKDGRLPTWSPR